tara:strand:+ start:210 stop:470 length:261 start_codon:yes stop_codon:yes gene_type:complete
MNKLKVSINTIQDCKRELVKNGYLVIHRGLSSNYYELRLSKNYIGKVSARKQPPYPKTTQHYKSNTIIQNNNYNKSKAKGFKKFNE